MSIGLVMPVASRAIDEIAWSEAPDSVVVRYEVSTLPTDGAISVTIFGDGTVRSVRPAFWVGGGRSEWRLPRSEMRDLVVFLAGSGLADADDDALRSRVAAAGRQRLADGGSVRHRAGAARRTLELHLEAFRATPAAAARAVAQRFEWHDLAGDAAEFPEIDVLRRLADAERRLRALLSDPRARAVEEAP